MPGRNTSPDRLELIANNRHVVIHGHEPLRQIRCLGCQETWPLLPKDLKRWDWWLCRNLCNLRTRRQAIKLIRLTTEGNREFDREVIERSVQLLLDHDKAWGNTRGWRRPKGEDEACVTGLLLLKRDDAARARRIAEEITRSWNEDSWPEP